MMKPLVQKLPLNDNQSFVARTYRSPNFEVGWHQHIEFELILFTSGSGLSFVGNYVGVFEKGDIFLLGSNLPHTFQKREITATASAVVVQFSPDFLGNTFLELPEAQEMQNLLASSQSGLRISGESLNLLSPLIKQLETASGMTSLLLLLQCLTIISQNGEYTQVSTRQLKALNTKDAASIDRIFEYTIANFREPLTLETIAGLACMTVPAFCNYFKRCTKKTYIEFLNEVRIGYACTLLRNTKKPVLDICYDCGYQTMANFHKQFQKAKGFTPLQYRKYVNAKLPLPQNNIGII
ncbi:AraC family transcriptional regulator [Pedobacter sp. PWIIR3]